MTTKKSKRLYWLFKVLSVFISCAFPIWAIVEKFPMWRDTHGIHSFGVGFILILIVLTIVFRRTVFNFIRDNLNLKHAPPIVVWLIMLIISYILVYIGEFMSDLTTVLWMGLVGCAIGTVFTYIAEHCFRKKVENNE
jgi:hypothetical protein